MELATSVENFLAWAVEYAWIIQVFAIALATLIAGAVVRRGVEHVITRTRTTSSVIDDALFDALRGPTRGLVWVLGIAFAAHIAGRQTEAAIFDALPAMRGIGVIGIFTWFAMRFARSYEEHYVKVWEGADERVDLTFVHAIGKLVRGAIGITAVLIVLQTMGINIAGLLAFGGMGGIAVGLAARDLLANVFGGITIYLDRPFSVGDWIRSPDQEIEGTVEEIGWRRTLIRTFDKRPLYVPNAVFTTISVENPSRMLNRRIKESIGVRYDDVSRLPSILAEIRHYLNTSEDIDQSTTLMVNFDQFGPSSLDFFIYCFTRTVVWTEFHEVKERVLLTIADIIAKHGGEIAFPTRTVHMPEPLTIAADEERTAALRGAAPSARA